MSAQSSDPNSNSKAFSGDVGALAKAVNVWAKENQIIPISGQAAREVSIRNLRYYRSQALLDGPIEGGGYGTKHFLQVAAIRLLQAHGLPLARIRDLLYGRSEEELTVIFRDGVDDLHQPPSSSTVPAPGKTCTIHGLSDGFALLTPEGHTLSDEQIEAIRLILEPKNNSTNR